MGWMLDRSDKDWPEVRRNIRKARRFWSRMGKLIRREGADPRVSEIFYLTVVQSVLLFGSDTWILLTTIPRRLEGVHLGVLRKVTGHNANQKRYRTWIIVAEARVLKEAGTHTLGDYIDKRQETVTEWVVLRPIIEVCNR